MGYGSKSLNDWRDDALRIANEHGFKDASVAEDIALMHSELSEALEDHRAGKLPHEMRYEGKDALGHMRSFATPREAKDQGFGDSDRLKPVGIPSEMADVIIRVLHFSGKHGIDIEQAVREKMAYNESRPYKHGGKTL